MHAYILQAHMKQNEFTHLAPCWTSTCPDMFVHVNRNQVGFVLESFSHACTVQHRKHRCVAPAPQMLRQQVEVDRHDLEAWQERKGLGSGVYLLILTDCSLYVPSCILKKTNGPETFIPSCLLHHCAWMIAMV
jgi:hypothetical protein